ncbi:MAG: Ig-like domain-containing protein [Bacteroidales bacterium]
MNKILFILLLAILTACGKKEAIKVKDYTFTAALTVSSAEHSIHNPSLFVLKLDGYKVDEQLIMSYRINNATTESIQINGSNVSHDNYTISALDKTINISLTPSQAGKYTLYIKLNNTGYSKECSVTFDVTDVNLDFTASVELEQGEDFSGSERKIIMDVNGYTGEQLTMSYRINDKTTEKLLLNGTTLNSTDVILDTKIDKRFIFTYTPNVVEDKKLVIILQNEKVSRTLSLDISVRAIPSFIATLSALSGGKVEPSGKVSVKRSDKLEIKATPEKYFEFEKWSDNNISATRTVIITSDTVLMAKFREKKDHNFIPKLSIEQSDKYIEIERTIVLDLSTYTKESITMSYRIDGKSNEIIYNSLKEAVKSDNITLNTKFDKIFKFTYTPHQIKDKILTIYLDDGESKINIEAICEVIPYPEYTLTLAAIPANGGLVDPPGATKIKTSSTVVIKATPNKFYDFEKWNDGNTNPVRTIVVADRDVSYTANFKEYEKFTLSLSATPGGTVEPNSPVIKYKTETVSIKATPLPHYIFEKWSDGNTSATRDIIFTKNLALQATFTPVLYKVSGTVNPAGSGRIEGLGSYAYDSPVNIKAIPEAGYGFDYFMVNNKQNSQNPLSFTVTGDFSADASFYPLVKNISTNQFSEQGNNMKACETRNFNMQVLPETAKNKKLTYSSSDERIASVNVAGLVEANYAGECTLKVKTTDGSNLEKSYSLTISDAVDVYIYATRERSDPDDPTSPLTEKVYLRSDRSYPQYHIIVSGNYYSETGNLYISYDGTFEFKGEILLGESTYTPHFGEEIKVSANVHTIKIVEDQPLISLQYNKDKNLTINLK